MGKSPKPLSFLVHPSLVQTDEDRQRLDDLAAQGHHVDTADCEHFYNVIGMDKYDIVLGPNCWRAFDLRHLDLAIKSSRSVKYGTAKAKVAKKPRAPRKKKGDKGLEQS